MPEILEKGHRQRLRDRFINGDADSRSEEALLELLLTYATPQKDVQPLAKRLLAEYGGLSPLLEIPMERLYKFDGIKENSAVFLKLVDWIRQNYSPKRPIIETAKTATQATLFEAVSPEKTGQPASVKDVPRHKKVAPRHGTEMFGKAVLKEAIQLLPSLPDTESLDEIRTFLRAKLHFSAEQTRHRYASYITRRMFPDGYADGPLRSFSRTFPDTQELRDVCFYRFLQSEPLEAEIIEELILPNIGIGRLGRERIRKRLAERFPEARIIVDCGKAIVDALTAAGIAKPVNVNRGILDAIPDDEFRQLEENEAKRPEPTAAHVAKAFERFLGANLTGKGILVLSKLEMLFAYHIELNLLRTMAADEDRVLLLLPGRRSRGRIIMFHEMDEGDYTLPTNLIAENHLWEVRE